MNKPEGFEDCLSSFGPMIYDSYSGETISWGFRITSHIGEERFSSLSKFGGLKCVYPNWFLITRNLTAEEAIHLYGPITEIERGPRGGFKSVTFGDKKFKTKLDGL
jgi:hypothetical protein